MHRRGLRGACSSRIMWNRLKHTKGPIHIQVTCAVVEFPLSHRIAEEAQEADAKSRFGVPRGFIPQGVPEAQIPHVDHQLQGDAGRDAEEQVGRHGDQDGDREDEQLLCP